MVPSPRASVLAFGDCDTRCATPAHFAFVRLKPRGRVILQVRVKPRAQSSELLQAADGTWLAKLKAPPVDGKANEELVRLVAERFQCPKAAVTIRSGASGRTKLVEVARR